MERLLRWLIFAIAALVPRSAFAERLELSHAAPIAPKELVVPRAADHFEAYEALHGLFSSPGHCAGLPGGASGWFRAPAQSPFLPQARAITLGRAKAGAAALIARGEKIDSVRAALEGLSVDPAD